MNRTGAGAVGMLVAMGATVALAVCIDDRAAWIWLGPLSLCGLVGATLVAWAKTPLRQVLALALALRLVAATMPGLALSDDLYRYLWDGRVAGAGHSPYAYRPNDPALASLRDTVVFPRLNSTSYYTVYPPVSQAVFRMAGAAEQALGTAWGLRALRGAGWLLEGLALLLLARLARDRPYLMSVFALYALHPLAVVESGQGHTELYALPMLAAAVLLRSQQRDGWAGMGIGLAGGVKLVPFILVPVFFRQRWKGWFAAASMGAVAVAVIGANATHLMDSLRLYTSYFEFNAPLYRLLKQGLGMLLGGDTGPLAARVLLLTFGMVALGALRSNSRTGAVWLAFLACSTTVHPWYLLPVLLLAVGEEDGRTARATAWLAACAFGTYTHYTTGSDGLWTWGGWLGAAALVMPWPCLLEGILRRRARQKAFLVTPLLPINSTILDLGAGEGYVGEQLAHNGHRVTLADVADFNRSSLPFVRVTDGKPLPFGDSEFDAAVLVFVLHHARDPEALLREARRVARRVIVLESVYETESDRRLLDTLDRAANRLRSPTMREQEAHLHFRTAEAWSELARSLGAKVTMRRLGRWPHKQALLVLERA